MTKVATIEVIVPDTIKPDDDVFNYMRTNGCKMKITGFKDNPADPPMVKQYTIKRIMYQARGAQDASDIETAINNALVSIPGVTQVDNV